MYEVIITVVVPETKESWGETIEPANTQLFRFEFEDDGAERAINASLGWLHHAAVSSESLEARGTFEGNEVPAIR